MYEGLFDLLLNRSTALLYAPTNTALKEITLSKLAEKIGTSQPNLSNKLKRDNFSEKELNQIAEVLEVKYEANFVLEDIERFKTDN
ncbi:helix-turn-helix domain-containing protein [Lysinibacillus xylanilyticus]|uniref:helix-turn-helix domain-containing protein n=1 Tax=Lysinibacillus xylanilyticus TaxID=582475 RepID=UPI0037F8B64D